MNTQRLSILIYHRVLPHPDPLLPDLPDKRCFEQQMAVLHRFFNVLPLDQAIQRLREHSLPPRAACITFDDGYADNAEHALPILCRYGLHATFFIASAYLDGGQMWNDDLIAHVRQNGSGTLVQRRRHLERLLEQFKYMPCAERSVAARCLSPTDGGDLMMNTRQLRSLIQAGMSLGAHTHRHPILSLMPDQEAYADIARGKAELEAITQAPVTLFAYPNGKPGRDYNERHVAMVRELGFDAAVSTQAGVAHAHSDLLQLPRFTPWEQDRPRFLLRLMASRNKLA